MKIPIGTRNKLIYFIEKYKQMMKNYDMEDTPYFFRCYKEKIWILFHQQYLRLIIMIFLIKENSNLFL